MAPLRAKNGYTPVSPTDSLDTQPGRSSHQQLSGHTADGDIAPHWSGLSPEQARDFKGCPSNRIVFPEYDAGFFTYWSYQWMTPLMKLGNRCHLQDEDVEAARVAIDTALMIDPDYPPALNQYGVLLRKNGRILEAEAAYLKAITADPEYAWAHYNLGVLYELYLQRLGDALQHFERYQDLAGDDPQVEKWITDLERRVAANQRTANVAE